jgi:hypothetical protein
VRFRLFAALKMKTAARFVYIASCALAFLPATLAYAAPPVSAREALGIAEKNLAERGLDKRLYVIGITLEHASMFSSKGYWFVKWSEPIPASNPRNREVGIKVNMDGSAVRLVKEPGAA